MNKKEKVVQTALGTYPKYVINLEAVFCGYVNWGMSVICRGTDLDDAYDNLQKKFWEMDQEQKHNLFLGIYKTYDDFKEATEDRIDLSNSKGTWNKFWAADIVGIKMNRVHSFELAEDNDMEYYEEI